MEGGKGVYGRKSGGVARTAPGQRLARHLGLAQATVIDLGTIRPFIDTIRHLM
jgi:hypothetical protein